MSKSSNNTEAHPMTWDQFKVLISQMSYDIDNADMSDNKKTQLVKFFILISVGCYCGLRIGDILKLRWMDVLNRDTLQLVEQKTSKSRQITINDNLKKLFTKYVDYIKPITYNEFIFTNIGGGVISIQYVNKRLKQLFVKYKIKVENPSSHTLRKTFGLRVYEMNYKNDDALITLSHIFNHSNTSITRRYIGLEGKKIKNVYLSL